MLLPLDKLNRIYDQILQNSNIEGNRCNQAVTQIFVSNSVDSICALKILLTLLKSDQLQYILTPVFSNSHLIQEINKLKNTSQSLRSLIFINCGGNLDQTSLWYYQNQAKFQIFLFDSHRPFHHHNLIDVANKIHIIHDGCSTFENLLTLTDIQLLQNYQQEEENSDSEESNQLSDIDEVEEELKDLRDSGSQEMLDESDEEYKKGDVEKVKVGKKRQRLQQEQLIDKKRLFRKVKAKFRVYYQGTFIWKCIGGLMYHMSQSVNRETREFLWLWIVGLTDNMLHQLNGSSQLYQDDILKLNDEVQRLNPHIYFIENEKMVSDSADKSDPSIDNPRILTQHHQVVEPKPKDIDLFKHVQTKNSNQEIGTIMIINDLKLMLLKHWTLHDSMINSNYIVSNLKTWTEPGVIMYKRFLATIGIPIEESKQKYNFMAPLFKNDLVDKIANHSDRFLLDQILITSYTKQVDSKTILSSNDTVYILNGILENFKTIKQYRELIDQDIDSIQKKNQQFLNPEDILISMKQRMHDQRGQQQERQLENQKKSIQNNLNIIKECEYENFFKAYDALDFDKKKYFEEGIELAKEIQQAIISIGTQILQKKQVKVATHFRYVMMNNESIKDIQVFQYPMAIRRLGLFIMETYREIKCKSKDKPLVITIRNTFLGTTLIVAILGLHSNQKGIIGKNHFGQVFHLTVEATNIRAKHDSFDSSIIEIKNEDFRAFMESLVSFDINNTQN
ncbi:cell division control protein 45 [Stylonychia lemnae]|uniref:Cell division control protein 45 n=1 Tax=Stylonychia lemnae TaxID=5949 RepID=A0A077ZWT3_STYLE|nr:cell division control protein 45 [Stylonychia lemnae]|eukprot:CDW73747.1 cell division control protein 45 [Stylonychia lemnae]